ncbi:hypothetical protein PILCRDRAFT_824726 [Piloderma croceum F 1598]|uniref:PB1 domain-containing protein n=1 Tax=Piloderma croceum (strain F 1598) TaxID=765440 RepID=A0A0C3F0D0_PILCF|nr:hypothetical protein PILCRDRAFT_824726 [Piloderma croceum F 1598]
MSLKAELETWASALKAYDEENLEKALNLFATIADSSKILTNMGLIYATLGEHELAVEQFIAATSLDQYLAVAYFQCGVSNFLLSRYELALKDFDEALLYLRGNQAINYEQLGLKFKLFSAEVMFNKGLSLIYMGNLEEGLADMEEARKEKATEEHTVIDDAIQDRGEGYTVFSIPVGVLYRPSENKLKNSKTKDYMGKAKLVTASDENDQFTTFTGATRLKSGVSPSNTFVAQPNIDAGPGLSRSLTAPPPRNDPIDPPIARGATGLGRSKTTLTRGLSVRKVSATEERRPPVPEKDSNAGVRLTEFFDDYIDSYGDEPPPPPPVPSLPSPSSGSKSDKISAWAQANANPSPVVQRSASRSAPSSTYAPSNYGGGSMKRKLTRRNTRRLTAAPSMYNENEEEGYGSGEYDDGPFELVKIRVKLYYDSDVRGMALTPDTRYEEFLERVTSKFGKSLDGLEMKFKDEDGGKVSLRDDSDYDLAIETAREHAKGKPEGKLEIWCMDV